MPPEQLKAAMAQAGNHLPPGFDPDMLSQMADTVANMPSEQLQAMAQAARAQTAAAPGGTSSSSSAPSSSGRAVAPASTAGSAAAAAAMGAGGLPDMSAMMSPEMLKMATDMMKHMKPEDMAAMSSMMAGGQPPTAGKGRGMSRSGWGVR
jgi:hypothetical protein